MSVVSLLFPEVELSESWRRAFARPAAEDESQRDRAAVPPCRPPGAARRLQVVSPAPAAWAEAGEGRKAGASFMAPMETNPGTAQPQNPGRDA